MKQVWVCLRAVEGKGHSPGVDLEMDEAEYQRLSTDYRLRETLGNADGGSQVKSYECQRVTLHLDEIEHLIDGEAFPPGKRPLK